MFCLAHLSKIPKAGRGVLAAMRSECGARSSSFLSEKAASNEDCQDDDDDDDDDDAAGDGSAAGKSDPTFQQLSNKKR